MVQFAPKPKRTSVTFAQCTVQNFADTSNLIEIFKM